MIRNTGSNKAMSTNPIVRPKAADLPYRRCVGIMVLNDRGEVWIGHRVPDPDSEYDGSPRLWQMPQGGVDEGEDPLQAARRELYEETGIRSVSLLEEAPVWINYDLPESLIGIGLKGKYRGQTQRWFAFRFEGDESEIAVNPPPDGHPTEFDAWRWAPMGDLPELIVPFKRAVYERVVATFAHLAGPKSGA
jgi:putative (di)nucleoside polyphosphate hydrolase